jgi:lipopolysaccharide/colanic/teichoic acid biosynthesis glycosyltransferase
VFKMRNDPRVTRVGGFLRRTSMDEMPQILNVLLGNMSIVGPRPPLPRACRLRDGPASKLQVTPGLAGVWQSRGRRTLPFDEMVKHDLEYIERRSFWFDLKLILLTIPCVITAEEPSSQ